MPMQPAKYQPLPNALGQWLTFSYGDQKTPTLPSGTKFIDGRPVSRRLP